MSLRYLKDHKFDNNIRNSNPIKKQKEINENIFFYKHFQLISFHHHKKNIFLVELKVVDFDQV
jgi:hypothetical protein